MMPNPNLGKFAAQRGAENRALDPRQSAAYAGQQPRGAPGGAFSPAAAAAQQLYDSTGQPLGPNGEVSPQMAKSDPSTMTPAEQLYYVNYGAKMPPMPIGWNGGPLSAGIPVQQMAPMPLMPMSVQQAPWMMPAAPWAMPSAQPSAPAGFTGGTGNPIPRPTGADVAQAIAGGASPVAVTRLPTEQLPAYGPESDQPLQPMGGYNAEGASGGYMKRQGGAMSKPPSPTPRIAMARRNRR